MFELEEKELKFLDAMGVIQKGDVFTDKESGRIFLFAGKKTDYTPDKYHYPLRSSIAYECGDDALVFIRQYYYTDKPFSKDLWQEISVIRVLRDGLWHNMENEEVKGTFDGCSIATEPLKPKTGKRADDINEYYYYLLANDKLSFGISSNGGFYLYISDHDALKCCSGRTIRCNGKTIRVEGEPKETVDFSYENFVALLEKYASIAEFDSNDNAFPLNVQVMCSYLIPSLLAQGIEEKKKEIEIKRQSYTGAYEEKKQLATLEKIYEEFTQHTEDTKDNTRHTLYKHLGEVK